MIDYDKFAATPLVREPFEYLVVRGFIPPDMADAANASFRAADLPGVLPAPLQPTPDAFGRLLTALRSPCLTSAFADKFGLPLSTDMLMVTVRSRCRSRDGAIHTDSALKQVTALIYLNDDWPHAGGQLRLLNSPDDIEDMIAEVPPVAGTLIAFRRADNSWHGHKPFDGVRRAIMLNWMTSVAAARHEISRHAISSRLKRLVTAMRDDR